MPTIPPPYKVPHTEHLLAILALGLLIHPAAGGFWACVWGFHTFADAISPRHFPTLTGAPPRPRPKPTQRSE